MRFEFIGQHGDDARERVDFKDHFSDQAAARCPDKRDPVHVSSSRVGSVLQLGPAPR
jgi:hypothetical protein